MRHKTSQLNTSLRNSQNSPPWGWSSSLTSKTLKTSMYSPISPICPCFLYNSQHLLNKTHTLQPINMMKSNILHSLLRSTGMEWEKQSTIMRGPHISSMILATIKIQAHILQAMQTGQQKVTLLICNTSKPSMLWSLFVWSFPLIQLQVLTSH